MAIRVVLFDAVGTLIHPEPAAGLVYARIGRRYGSQLAEAEIRERFKQAFAAEEEADRQNGWRTNEVREEARWRNIVTRVLDDIEDRETCFRELYAWFARPDAWRCAPEIDHLLRGLQDLGLMTGLASNFDGRLRQVLAGLPELRSVGQVFVSAELGWRKPGTSFFSTICDQLRVTAAEVLFVGDDRINDEEGARKAGMKALLLQEHVPGDGLRTATLQAIGAGDS